jgi:lincosamide nucleotidyltransferase A/C/D/E
MHDHVMDIGSTVELLTALGAGGADVRLSGGWAVDALLGEQTRVHSDLDLWLEATQFEQVITVLAQVGVDRLYPWGNDRPWNFVVHDGAQRRVDLHAYERLRDGSIHYGSFEVGETFPSDALDGRGVINGIDVRCEAVAWSLRWHTGYPARPVDFHDVIRLCQRFDLELPEGFSSLQAAQPEP